MAPIYTTPLQVAERLGFKLSEEQVKAAQVDAYIVDRTSAALRQLKLCRTEEERQDYGLVLAAVAPTREAKGDAHGMIAAVCKRLGVARGSRYIKASGERRPYAADQAITRREKWDELLQSSAAAPFKVGDRAMSRSRMCTIMAINYDADTCTVRFEKDGVMRDCDYTCIYKPKDAPTRAPFPAGSARLRAVPVSLRPSNRCQHHHEDRIKAARAHVVDLFESEGARSPSMRDEVRRRIGVRLYETAQALYIYSKFATLHRLFCERYPAHKLSFAAFKRLRPWYVRRAKQETCLCKQCENFKVHKEVLNTLVKLFADIVSPPCLDAEEGTGTSSSGDAEGDADATEVQSWAGRAALSKLLQMCALQFKSEMVKFTLCDGALEGAGKSNCVEGSCPHCGFDRIWSKGLRPHVVHGDTVLSTAPIEFQNQVSWTRATTSSKNTGNTEPLNQPAVPKYEARTGTVVEFLDVVESEVFKKYPLHRLSISRQKAMSAQFDRNRTPGWLQCDVDFAMDGEIPPPSGRAAQSDHWSPVTYTLFVMVVSWLERDAWRNRESALRVGDTVTVEAAEQSVPQSIEATPCSCWAEVVTVPTTMNSQTRTPPENELYGVRCHGMAEEGVIHVERRYLRRRKIRTEAFAHVSNDKTHDSNAAQTFINKTLDHLDAEYVKTGKEKFFAIRMHSDNAPSHFKSSQTLNYVTLLRSRQQSWADGLPFSVRIFWEFGAPGHGKGVWDGIGAWIKRTVRQDITDDRPQQPILKTACGKILRPEHVAEHLTALYHTADFEEAHLYSTINKVVVIYTPTEEIKRPPGFKYTSMPGMKKTHLFMAVRDGVILQRQFSCWCMACMRASAPGEGTMDSNYRCIQCETQSLTWRETVVEREDAPGIQERR